jgi:RecG-like helicase
MTQNINTKKQAICDIPARFVKGVGPARSEILRKLDIETVEDLLYLFSPPAMRTAAVLNL